MALRAWKKYISTEGYVDAILQEYAADDLGERLETPEVRRPLAGRWGCLEYC